MRLILIKLHLWLGLTAGVVLCITAVSGALYAYEPQVRKLVGEPVTGISAEHPLLSPYELESRLKDHGRKGAAAWFRWSEDPALPARVGWRSESGELTEISVDPVTGEMLPKAGAIYAFFSVVLDVHRTLAMGETGRLITGFATIGLMVVSVSGLFIGVRRWKHRREVWLPKRREWRTQVPRLRLRLWHRVIGAWAMPWLLIVAATGLVWSFDWYATALKWIGGPPRFDTVPTLATPAPEVPLAWAKIWDNCLAAHTGDGAMRLILPASRERPVHFEWSPPGAFSSASRSRLFLDPTTGEVLEKQPLEAFTTGERLVRWAYPIHTGRAAGITGQTVAFAASLSVPFFFGSGLYLYRARRRAALHAAALSHH